MGEVVCYEPEHQYEYGLEDKRGTNGW